LPAKPVVWMTYNLGAATTATIGANTYDLTTPKGQMKWLTDKGANGGVVNTDATVYGGLFQWGRGYETDRTLPEQEKKGWKHAVKYTVVDGVITNRERRFGTGATYDAETRANVSINGYDANGQPNAPNDVLFVTGSTDWVTTSNDALWGNGQATTTETPGGGNPYITGGVTKYYQQPVKTVNDPCPAGWRVPTQDEWETLGNYCDSRNAGGSFSGIPLEGKAPGSYNPNLWWVPVANGIPDAGATVAWSTTKVGGYAIYLKTDWDSADDAYKTGVSPLYAENAPVPLLFLPAAGYRYYYDGSALDVGSYGGYWSSSVNSTSAYYLNFNSGFVYPNTSSNRAYGLSVRCVAE
jgi:hypothetical protein